MKMTIDFTNAKEQGNFLPAGKHTVKVTAIKAENTANGYPQVHITFGDKEGRSFTHYQSADFEKEWVRNWWYNFTKKAGLPVEKTNFTFDTNDLIGKPLFIEVKREYNDYTEKYNNRLKSVYKYEKEKVEDWNEDYPISPEEQAWKATQNETSATPSNNPFSNATGPIEISDDEMPF